MKTVTRHVAAVCVAAAGIAPAFAQAPEPITLAVRAGGCFTTYSGIASDYEKATGGKVTVEQISRNDYLQRITTQLLGGSTSIDLVLILHNYVPQFAQGGVIEPLNGYLDAAGLSMDRYLPVTAEAVTYNDAVYAIPYDVSTQHLWYRTDLIENPPTTIEEYRAVARDFTRSINPASPTEFGTTFQGKRGEALPKEWYNYFFAFGGKFLDEAGKPIINSQAGIDALSFVVENLRQEQIYPPDATTFEFPETVSAFSEGKTAMMVNWIGAYPVLDAERAPLVYDKFALTQTPGGKPYMQAWTMAMNAASTKKQAAFDFVNYVTTEALANYSFQPCFYPAVRSVLEDPATAEAHPEAPAFLAALNAAQTEPMLPEWPRIHEVINEALSVALAGEKTPQQALDDANAAIADLLD